VYDLPDEIQVEADGPLRIVTLNRAEKLNAVNAELHAGLARVWDFIAADDEACVAIVTGAGRAFSAGGDFTYMLSLIESPADRERSIAETQRILWAITNFPLPLIAAVNGPAVGLGCSLAASADIVLASDRSFFADPHVGVGLACGDGGAVMWPLLTSMLRCKEYLFTGDRIPADHAVLLGLANRVVPHDDLMAEARALADRLARQPQEALRQTKRALQLHVERAITGIVEAAALAELRTLAGEDHAAIVRAIVTTSR
jgi:enoyl-CoA hydratase